MTEIRIDVSRNDTELTGGWDEDALAAYLNRYIRTYGVVDRLRDDFPEYSFTNARLTETR